MTRRRARLALLSAGCAATLAAGTLVAFLLSGCTFIEKAGDAMADATAGTGLSSGFRSMARAAESMKDYEPSHEYYIGRSVAAQILSRYKVHPDKKLQEYVNLVGHAVLTAPEPMRTYAGYHFVVLEGEELQAVSAPGGFVFVTEGTVRRAKDEDELAAVLAHEIAHVSLRHGIGAIKAATRRQSFALLVQGVGQGASEYAGSQGDAGTQQLAELTGTFANAIQDITGELLEKGYSRDLEIAADQEAAKYLQSSAYARGALASYLKGVGAEKAGGEGGWTATHPSPQDRVAALGELATGDSPGRPVRRQRFEKVLGGG